MGDSKKHSICALYAVMAVTGLIIALFYIAIGSSNASSRQVESEQNLPTITVEVTLPPVTIRDVTTLPPVTIKPPPLTIEPPVVTRQGPTVTVTHRETVTAPGNPTVTKTVTVRPNTARPSERPRATVTVTDKQKPKKAPPHHRDEPVEKEPTESVVKYVAAGVALVAALTGLGILAMFVGYIIGQKDAKKNENDFLESLLSRAKLRSRQ